VRYSPYIKFIHFIVDICLLNISFLGAYYIEFNQYSFTPDAAFFAFLLFLNLSWIALIYLFRPYKISRVSGALKIIKYHISVITIHLLLAASYLAFKDGIGHTPEFIFSLFSWFYTLVVLWKFFLLSFLRMYRRKGFNYKNVVIAGYGKLSNRLIRFFNHHPEHGYKLLGIFDDKNTAEINSLGNFEMITDYVLTNKVDEIYCCLPYINHIQVKQLIKFGEENQVSIKLISDLVTYSTKHLELEHYGKLPVVNVTSFPLDNFENRFYKRTFDILFSSSVIIFLMSWLFPIIAIFIKTTSKGPIFFKQKRTGKNSRSFWCYKFRTMTINQEADTQQAIANDPRITKIGWFLRETGLDELPQFFNVLIGDMSVVGPRPHMLRHTKEFSQKVDRYMFRHSIKPGITGLAQAKGFRGEINTISCLVNRVKLDRFYVENWSLLFDFKIIVLTIQSILFAKE
jgi:putative colanic acid biosysnthesis UDP-glucose lipid carrier transferase